MADITKSNPELAYVRDELLKIAKDFLSEHPEIFVFENTDDLALLIAKYMSTHEAFLMLEPVDVRTFAMIVLEVEGEAPVDRTYIFIGAEKQEGSIGRILQPVSHNQAIELCKMAGIEMPREVAE